MPKQESVPYEEVFLALNKEGINYAICGGLAVVLYGYARLTVDLDLIVSLEKESLEKLYNTLTKLNYKPQIPIKKEEFIQKKILEKLAEDYNPPTTSSRRQSRRAPKNMKVVSFYNSKDPLKVIDVGVNLPKISEILKKKKRIKIDGFTVPIILIDDLIKMKEDLARPHDLTDVENLKKIKKEERH